MNKIYDDEYIFFYLVPIMSLDSMYFKPLFRFATKLGKSRKTKKTGFLKSK